VYTLNLLYLISILGYQNNRAFIRMEKVKTIISIMH